MFWPGEFHGLHSPWGHKESDTTERLSLSLSRGYKLLGKQDETLILGMSIPLLLKNTKVSPCKRCSYTQGMNKYLSFP